MTAQVEVQDGDDKELKITNTYSSTPVVPDTETLTLQKAFVNAPTVDKSKITFTVDKDGNVTLDSTVTTGVSEVKDGKIVKTIIPDGEIKILIKDDDQYQDE